MLWGHSPSPSTSSLPVTVELDISLLAAGVEGLKTLKNRGKRIYRGSKMETAPLREVIPQPGGRQMFGEGVKTSPTSRQDQIPWLALLQPQLPAAPAPPCVTGDVRRPSRELRNALTFSPPLPVWGEETAKNKNKNKLVIPKGLLRIAKGSEGRLGAARVFSSPSKWFCGLYS